MKRRATHLEVTNIIQLAMYFSFKQTLNNDYNLPRLQALINLFTKLSSLTVIRKSRITTSFPESIDLITNVSDIFLIIDQLKSMVEYHLP